MSGSGDEATEAFAAALRTAREALGEVPGMLEGARVHDFAFGRLFEAAEVRDAYHSRLPETEQDVGEACEVIDHFVAGLAGGHAIAARGGPGAGPDPGDPPSTASATRWTADTFPWCRLLPEQGGSVEP